MHGYTQTVNKEHSTFSNLLINICTLPCTVSNMHVYFAFQAHLACIPLCEYRFCNQCVYGSTCHHQFGVEGSRRFAVALQSVVADTMAVQSPSSNIEGVQI